MKRWNIQLPDTSMTLYYADLETARAKYPKAINITENFDYGYLEFVDKIKAVAQVECDHKGKRVYKIPYNSAYILVHLWYDIENGKEFYYDGCDFQRHDECTGAMSIMWTWSTPKEFYEQFLKERGHVELPIEVISLRELKKLNPVKFHNKNGKALYRDCYGYFYIVNKHDLPNKKKCAEYAQFKGNPNAVFARIDSSYKVTSAKWFDSIYDLLQEFEQYKKDTPASFGTPFYTIMKRGYTKVAPEDREIVFRLPYFQLDKEVAYENNEKRRSEPIPWIVAQKWCGMMDGYTQFGRSFSNREWVKDLIVSWLAYTEKNNQEVSA